MATNRARINEKDKDLWCNFIQLEGKKTVCFTAYRMVQITVIKGFFPKMQTVELRLHLILTDLKMQKEKKKNDTLVLVSLLR